MTMADWMTRFRPALVVIGSYTDRHGRAATPLISGGVRQGPGDYDAKAGAFVSHQGSAGVIDLSALDYRTVFVGASDAIIS